MFYIKSLLIDVLLVASFSPDYDSKATDSAICRTALLGFAIRVGTLVNMKEGDNQRDQGEGLLPLSLSLRFSPKSVIPLERREEREHC
mgnify:CR=1 FL=1|jgi:hypothetical protein